MCWCLWDSQRHMRLWCVFSRDGPGGNSSSSSCLSHSPPSPSHLPHSCQLATSAPSSSTHPFPSCSSSHNKDTKEKERERAKSKGGKERRNKMTSSFGLMTSSFKHTQATHALRKKNTQTFIDVQIRRQMMFLRFGVDLHR
jgi:hypothetical protein